MHSLPQQVRHRPVICLIVWLFAFHNAAAEQAPSFSLRDLAGNRYTLKGLLSETDAGTKQRRSAIVLLDFFRTDCKPCVKALPKLLKLATRYSGPSKRNAMPVKVIIIALLEEEEGQAKLRAFFAEKRLPLLVLVDAYGLVAKRYIPTANGVQLPALVVLDEQGNIRARYHSLTRNAQKSLQNLLARLCRRSGAGASR